MRWLTRMKPTLLSSPPDAAGTLHAVVVARDRQRGDLAGLEAEESADGKLRLAVHIVDGHIAAAAAAGVEAVGVFQEGSALTRGQIDGHDAVVGEEVGRLPVAAQIEVPPAVGDTAAGGLAEMIVQKIDIAVAPVADAHLIAADLDLGRVDAVQGRLVEGQARLQAQDGQVEAGGRADGFVGVTAIGVAVVAQAGDQQIVPEQVEVLIAASLDGLVGQIPEATLRVLQLPAIHQGWRRFLRLNRRFRLGLNRDVRRFRRRLGRVLGYAAAAGQQAEQQK